LDKSEVIGNVNSRSFYLRKSNGGESSTLNSSERDHDLAKRSSANPPILLPSFVACKINKIVRRAHRLWNILVCSPWQPTMYTSSSNIMGYFKSSTPWHRKATIFYLLPFDSSLPFLFDVYIFMYLYFFKV